MSTHYTATAKFYHWLMTVLLFGLLALGFYMAELPFSPQKLQFYSWHKWAGVTAFLLVFFRLLWRLKNPPPPLPESMPKVMQWVAHVGHFALYVLMFAMPLSGWLMSSAKGFQTVYFGVLPIPDLIDKNKELGQLLGEVHETLAWLLIVLVAGHIAAALKHHFIDKDDVLIRMSPNHGKRSRGNPETPSP